MTPAADRDPLEPFAEEFLGHASTLLFCAKYMMDGICAHASQ
jgi:hypothetical protein